MKAAPEEAEEIPGDDVLAGGPALDRIVKTLSRDGLVAYPTESFYGLGANATSEAAIDRLFEAKGRPAGIPVPVIVGDAALVADLVTDISESARKLMGAFWPGPLTLVFRAARDLPARVTGGTGNVGVRVPGHSVAAALAQGCPFPITATSANRSGGREACSPAELDPALRRALDLIIAGGRTAGRPPSTVLDVTVDPPRLVRSGRVSESEIQAVLKAP